MTDERISRTVSYTHLDQKIPFANAFEIADDVLRQAVQSISDLIRDTGFINLAFADVTAIMKDAGLALSLIHIFCARRKRATSSSSAARGTRPIRRSER